VDAHGNVETLLISDAVEVIGGITTKARRTHIGACLVRYTAIHGVNTEGSVGTGAGDEWGHLTMRGTRLVGGSPAQVVGNAAGIRQAASEGMASLDARGVVIEEWRDGTAGDFNRPIVIDGALGRLSIDVEVVTRGTGTSKLVSLIRPEMDGGVVDRIVYREHAPDGGRTHGVQINGPSGDTDTIRHLDVEVTDAAGKGCDLVTWKQVSGPGITCERAQTQGATITVVRADLDHITCRDNGQAGSGATGATTGCYVVADTIVADRIDVRDTQGSPTQTRGYWHVTDRAGENDGRHRTDCHALDADGVTVAGTIMQNGGDLRATMTVDKDGVLST
jgi:hypothetical protein